MRQAGRAGAAGQAGTATARATPAGCGRSGSSGHRTRPTSAWLHRGPPCSTQQWPGIHTRAQRSGTAGCHAPQPASQPQRGKLSSASRQRLHRLPPPQAAAAAAVWAWQPLPASRLRPPLRSSCRLPCVLRRRCCSRSRSKPQLRPRRPSPHLQPPSQPGPRRRPPPQPACPPSLFPSPWDGPRAAGALQRAQWRRRQCRHRAAGPRRCPSRRQQRAHLREPAPLSWALFPRHPSLWRRSVCSAWTHPRRLCELQAAPGWPLPLHCALPLPADQPHACTQPSPRCAPLQAGALRPSRAVPALC